VEVAISKNIADSKELWQLRRITNRIHTNDFSEDDVFLLLIILRRHSKQFGVLREFADFLAHREKDRGMIFNYVKYVKGALDRPLPIEGIVAIRPVFTVEDLTVEINAILSVLDLLTLSPSRMNNVMICAISLLQCVEIWEKGKSIAQLHIAITSKEIMLLGQIQLSNMEGVGCAFTALTAMNTVLDVADEPGKDWVQFTGVGWARSLNNEFFFNQHQTTFLG
jgi:hypothetical protein